MTELSITPRRSQAAFGHACTKLRALRPEHPRVFAVAAMVEQGKRRWWPLSGGAREGRIELMYQRHAAEIIRADIAAEVVATALIHAVIGRVSALLIVAGARMGPRRGESLDPHRQRWRDRLGGLGGHHDSGIGR